MLLWEGGGEGALHLLEGGFSVVALSGGLALVAKDELYFLHAEAALVEEGAAGVAGEVPVQVFLEACLLGYLAEVGVAVAVVADGGELLGRGVAAEQGEGLAGEEDVEG